MRHAFLAIAAAALIGCFDEQVVHANSTASRSTHVPDFGATVTQTPAPPATSGGTLMVTRDGRIAIAADPDRDRVYLVDLSTRTLTDTIRLEPGDEPGRIAEDSSGRVHVVLRGGASIATIALDTHTYLRRTVCASPRGIAFEPGADMLYVACAGGDVLTLPAAGGTATRRTHIDRDLRDVVIDGGHVRITTFRSAQLLDLGVDGALSNRTVLARAAVADGQGAMLHFTPAVAWRAVAIPTGGVLVVHQRGQDEPVSTAPGGYGTGVSRCASSVVHSTVSIVRADEPVRAAPSIIDAVLPIDVALSPDGTRYAIAAPANRRAEAGAQVYVVDAALMAREGGCLSAARTANPDGDVTSVAFDPAGTVLALTREPAALHALGTSPWSLSLAAESRADTGHTIFHANAGLGVACASCHAEGADDGRVWSFASAGRLRTQSLRGGISGTEPFHWRGDITDFSTLVRRVFVDRMGGPELRAAQVASLQHWIDRIPLVAHDAPPDVEMVERGAALFRRDDVGCAGCHSGERRTNNVTVDVGTGAPTQVPSLVGIVDRAPFMHNGCAPTLRDRFGSCGGSRHGTTQSLTTSQVSDLVAYLETL